MPDAKLFLTVVLMASILLVAHFSARAKSRESERDRA